MIRIDSRFVYIILQIYQSPHAHTNLCLIL